MLTALAVSVLLQASNANILNETSRDGRQVASITGSPAFDRMARSVLKCYHGTARYRDAHLLEAPWEKQLAWHGDRSALIRISYAGASGQQYSMMVGLVGRSGMLKAEIQSDNARAKPNPRCSLNDWRY
ncbi:MAG: hypothetical protein ACRYGK_01305 [Janthinobacterium lividum]